MNETQNYLLNLKQAYNRTLVLTEKFNDRIVIYTSVLKNNPQKRSLKGKISSKMVNVLTAQISRKYITKVNEINSFLDGVEYIYNNLATCKNIHDAKIACEQSVALLTKFADMLEDLYNHTCSVYNINGSITNAEQEITK